MTYLLPRTPNVGYEKNYEIHTYIFSVSNLSSLNTYDPSTTSVEAPKLNNFSAISYLFKCAAHANRFLKRTLKFETTLYLVCNA